jgi:hypothetical protein
MRSDLVFGAMTYIPDRYLLSQVASKGSRQDASIRNPYAGHNE